MCSKNNVKDCVHNANLGVFNIYVDYHINEVSFWLAVDNWTPRHPMCAFKWAFRYFVCNVMFPNANPISIIDYPNSIYFSFDKFDTIDVTKIIEHLSKLTEEMLWKFNSLNLTLEHYTNDCNFDEKNTKLLNKYDVVITQKRIALDKLNEIIRSLGGESVELSHPCHVVNLCELVNQSKKFTPTSFVPAFDEEPPPISESLMQTTADIQKSLVALNAKVHGLRVKLSQFVFTLAQKEADVAMLCSLIEEATNVLHSTRKAFKQKKIDTMES